MSEIMFSSDRWGGEMIQIPLKQAIIGGGGGVQTPPPPLPGSLHLGQIDLHICTEKHLAKPNKFY